MIMIWPNGSRLDRSTENLSSGLTTTEERKYSELL